MTPFTGSYMNIAYLLTGGNMGDRLQTLIKAKAAIEKNCGSVAQASDVYETQPWGKTDQENFLNQALEVHTHLNAADLLTCLLQIEHQLGRERTIKYGPRLIDIDILLFNDDMIHTAGLRIPHPEMQHRRFALQCLADIAPHKMHPVLHQTIAQLLAACADPLQVHKFLESNIE